MRTATIERNTKETQIKLTLNLDGAGEANVDSGCGFLDHMLTLFAKHGKFDITLSCKGDVEVDFHHTTEDIGICLGMAFKRALGDKRGITRYGDTVLPMDEALILSAVDISGRSYLGYNVNVRAKRVGNFDVELIEEFWTAFVGNASCNVHIQQLAGKNTHHVLEGIFKSVARSLRKAVEIDTKFAGDLPSTKGVL